MAKFEINPKLQLSLWIALLISAVLYFIGKQIPQESLQSFVIGFGPLAPIVFVVTHQLSYVIAPISGLPFLIVGYFLFGKTVIIYLYFAGLLGMSVNFLIARKWGRPLLSKLLDKESFKKLDKFENEYGVWALIAFRVLNGGVSDFISYAYGITKIPFRTYITISALATIPGQILWYYIVLKTGSIEGVLGATWVLALLGAGIFLGGNYFVRNRKKKLPRAKVGSDP